MTALVIMIFFCTAFAAFSQRREMSLKRHKKESRERIFFSMLTCYMIVFAGLRVYYNDTYAYLKGFASSPKFPEVLSDMDWKISSHPGFKIFIALIKTATDNPNVYLMICSAITLSINIWFIRKYSKNFMLSIFLYFTLGYYTFTLAAIKQTLATAFALIAFDKLLQKKKLSYVLFILLGLTFHPYCFMYFLAPLLMKQTPWKKGTWLLIVLVLSVSYSFNFLQRVLIDATSLIGEGFDANTFVGEGINIFRVLVYFVPVIISFLWKNNLFETSTKADNLFMNCTIVCALIMFIGLFGNANMFARMAMYFEPFIYIALPWMLYKLKGKMAGLVLTAGCYTAFPMYFYYQMVITSQFDQVFKSISLGQFLNSLF